MDIQGNPVPAPVLNPDELRRIPFAPEVEAEIISLSGWLKLLGAVNCGLAVLQSIADISAGRLNVLQIAMYAFIGWSALEASHLFNLIAVTDHADQAFLVKAFRSLQGMFILQAISVVLAVAAIALVAVIFGCLALVAACAALAK